MLKEITQELNNEKRVRERAMSRSYQPHCSSTLSQNLKMSIAAIELGGNRQGKKEQQQLMTSNSLVRQLTADRVKQKSSNEPGKSSKRTEKLRVVNNRSEEMHKQNEVKSKKKFYIVAADDDLNNFDMDRIRKVLNEKKYRNNKDEQNIL